MGAAAPPADLAAVFAAAPAYSDAALSPDGKHLALVSPNDAGDRLAIFEIGSAAPPVVATLNESEVANVAWAKNDRVVVAVSRRKLDDVNRFHRLADRALAISVDGKNTATLLSNTELQATSSSTQEIADLNPTDPNYIFMPAYFYRAQLRADFMPGDYEYNLYRVNLTNGGAARACVGTRDTAQWIMDCTGNLVARIETERGKGDRILLPDGNDYREIARINDRPDNKGQIAGLTEDGLSLAVIAQREGNRKGLYRFDLATGKWGETLYYDPLVDVVGGFEDENSQRVAGVVYLDGGLSKWKYFSPEREAVTSRLQRGFPGRNILFVSWSADRANALFEVSDGMAPTVLYHIDTRTNRVASVAGKQQQIDRLPVPTREELTYPGSDNAALKGMLVLPPGREPKALPLIVMTGESYGGPYWIRDFLSQKGYAAFYAGRRAHKELGDLSGMGELGTWMTEFQEDIRIGVKHLVDKGIVDPKRVCVFGQGMDGYAALSTGAFSADTISCTISIHGYSELKPLVEDQTYARSFGQSLFSSELVRNSGNYSVEDLERF